MYTRIGIAVSTLAEKVHSVIYVISGFRRDVNLDFRSSVMLRSVEW